MGTKVWAFFAMRMTSTHIPFAAGASLLALLAAPGSPRAGAACRPTAVVEGAAEIVTPIAAVLRRRGVGTGPSECGRVVRASLAARPDLDTYSLHIEDGYGRVSDREVADAGTAASLIESWAIDEDADVLAPRVAPVPLEIITAAAAAPDAPPVATWHMDALGELATATDGSRLVRRNAGGVRPHRACLRRRSGPDRARYARRRRHRLRRRRHRR